MTRPNPQFIHYFPPPPIGSAPQASHNETDSLTVAREPSQSIHEDGYGQFLPAMNGIHPNVQSWQGTVDKRIAAYDSLNADIYFSQQTYCPQAQSLQVRMLLTSTVGVSFCTNDCSPEPQSVDLSTNMFSNLIEVEQSEDARELNEGELTHIDQMISFKHLRALRWLVRLVMVIQHSVMSLGAWTSIADISWAQSQDLTR